MVRWASPEQFHLTLKFLGSVRSGDVGALSETARAVCASMPPLRLRAQGIVFFPNDFSPRVLWVEIKNPGERLLGFQHRLETAVQPFVEKEEPKKFTPHVTLARFEKLRLDEAEKFATLARTNKTFGEWKAGEVLLMESKLQQTGALHAILEKFGTKND